MMKIDELSGWYWVRFWANKKPEDWEVVEIDVRDGVAHLLRAGSDCSCECAYENGQLIPQDWRDTANDAHFEVGRWLMEPREGEAVPESRGGE